MSRRSLDEFPLSAPSVAPTPLSASHPASESPLILHPLCLGHPASEHRWVVVLLQILLTELSVLGISTLMPPLRAGAGF